MKTLITLFSLFTITAYAQTGATGGGDPTASDLQDFINEIDAYLLTSEGKLLFPEVKQPDFHNISITVRPVVKNERVYDEFSVEQACISHVEEKNRFIQCDLQRLKQIKNEQTYYRLMFHELLFQVGLEKPISKDIPSDFSISSRLVFTKRAYKKTVIGNTLANFIGKLNLISAASFGNCPKTAESLNTGVNEIRLNDISKDQGFAVFRNINEGNKCVQRAPAFKIRKFRDDGFIIQLPRFHPHNFWYCHKTRMKQNVITFQKSDICSGLSPICRLHKKPVETLTVEEDSYLTYEEIDDGGIYGQNRRCVYMKE